MSDCGNSTVCHQLTSDVSLAVKYLRKDVLRNDGSVEAIERNVPSVPREAWVAKRRGTVTGTMLLEQFGDRATVTIRADGGGALGALLDMLDPDKEFEFVIQDDIRAHLLERLPSARQFAETVSMTVSKDRLVPVQSAGQVRQLTLADRGLTDGFPAPGPNEAPLSKLVEWAQAEPGTQVVYGLLVGTELVGFMQAGLAVDNFWGIGMIRVRQEERKKGFGKALLARGSSELLKAGKRPVYQVDHENVASIRTAEAVGYREAFRTYGYRATISKSRT